MGLPVYSTLVDIYSSSSLGVHPSPGLTLRATHMQCVCVCVRVRTYTHTVTHTPTPRQKIDKTQITPLSILLSKKNLPHQKKWSVWTDYFKRMCIPCSECVRKYVRWCECVRKYVRWCQKHLCSVHTCILILIWDELNQYTQIRTHMYLIFWNNTCFMINAHECYEQISIGAGKTWVLGPIGAVGTGDAWAYCSGTGTSPASRYAFDFEWI